MFLGVVASLQVVYAVYSAVIISVALLWDGDIRSWLTVGVVSFLVQSPNLIIIANKWRIWRNMGVDRMNLGMLSEILLTPFALIGLAAIAATFIAILHFHREIKHHVQGRLQSHRLHLDPILVSWLLVSGGFFVLSFLADAN